MATSVVPCLLYEGKLFQGAFTNACAFASDSAALDVLLVASSSFGSSLANMEPNNTINVNAVSGPTLGTFAALRVQLAGFLVLYSQQSVCYGQQIVLLALSLEYFVPRSQQLM